MVLITFSFTNYHFVIFDVTFLLLVILVTIRCKTTLKNIYVIMYFLKYIYYVFIHKIFTYI